MPVFSTQAPIEFARFFFEGKLYWTTAKFQRIDPDIISEYISPSIAHCWHCIFHTACACKKEGGVNSWLGLQITSSSMSHHANLQMAFCSSTDASLRSCHCKQIWRCPMEKSDVGSIQCHIQLTEKHCWLPSNAVSLHRPTMWIIEGVLSHSGNPPVSLLPYIVCLKRKHQQLCSMISFMTGSCAQWFHSWPEDFKFEVCTWLVCMRCTGSACTIALLQATVTLSD